VPFNLEIPWETPITVIDGQPLRGMNIGVYTALEIARAKDFRRPRPDHGPHPARAEGDLGVTRLTRSSDSASASQRRHGARSHPRHAPAPALLPGDRVLLPPQYKVDLRRGGHAKLVLTGQRTSFDPALSGTG
jgi:hypothetical protein